MAQSERRIGLGVVFWTALVALSAYYLYRAISFRFLAPEGLGPSLLDKQLWFVVHLVFALPALIGAPLQFSTKLRLARPRLHRVLGRCYVVGASVAALTALYLGATIEYQGSRLPIILLALLWLFFTHAAWLAARRRDFPAHRLFMIRSYGLALVLVWLRLMGDIPQDVLFFYIDDQQVRDTTLEWMSWVIPLLIIELWLSWLPLARGRKQGPAGLGRIVLPLSTPQPAAMDG